MGKTNVANGAVKPVERLDNTMAQLSKILGQVSDNEKKRDAKVRSRFLHTALDAMQVAATDDMAYIRQRANSAANEPSKVEEKKKTTFDPSTFDDLLDVKCYPGITHNVSSDKNVEGAIDANMSSIMGSAINQSGSEEQIKVIADAMKFDASKQEALKSIMKEQFASFMNGEIKSREEFFDGMMEAIIPLLETEQIKIVDKKAFSDIVNKLFAGEINGNEDEIIAAFNNSISYVPQPMGVQNANSNFPNNQGGVPDNFNIFQHPTAQQGGFQERLDSALPPAVNEEPMQPIKVSVMPDGTGVKPKGIEKPPIVAEIPEEVVHQLPHEGTRTGKINNDAMIEKFFWIKDIVEVANRHGHEVQAVPLIHPATGNFMGLIEIRTYDNTAQVFNPYKSFTIDCGTFIDKQYKVIPIICENGVGYENTPMCYHLYGKGGKKINPDVFEVIFSVGCSELRTRRIPGMYRPEYLELNKKFALISINGTGYSREIKKAAIERIETAYRKVSKENGKTLFANIEEDFPGCRFILSSKIVDGGFTISSKGVPIMYNGPELSRYAVEVSFNADGSMTYGQVNG